MSVSMSLFPLRLVRWMVSVGVSLLLAVPVTAGEWVEVHSPNFTVLTDAGEETGRRIAREFELIRVVFQEAFGSRADPSAPIDIYLLEDERGMAELLPELWADETHARPSGIFRGGRDKNYVALRLDGPGDRPFATVYHEYFHVLAATNLGDLPLWLNEGFAGFWETTEIWADEVRIGIPNPAYLELLRRERPIPIEELFAVDRSSPLYNEADKVSIFYAQSWALVHYLLAGNSLGKEKLAGYLERHRKNEDPLPALGNLAALESRLTAYIEGADYRGYRQARPPSVPESELTVRNLSEVELLCAQAAFLTSGPEPQRARSRIDRALALAPDLAIAHEAEGFNRLALGQPERAFRSLEQAIASGSENFLTYYHYALLAGGTRAPIEKIFAALERTTELEPDFMPAHLLLAELANEWGRSLDRALASAERAIDLAPRAPEARRALGLVRSARGELEAAATAYRNAVALDRRAPRLWMELGYVLLEAGRAEGAVEAFREAIALSPKSVGLYQPLGIQLVELERYAEAAEAFDRVKDALPDDAELYYAMARAFAGSDRMAEALAAFDAAESMDPYDPRIPLDHGRALETAGRDEDAIRAFARSLSLDPEEPGLIHHRLGEALARAGRAEEAQGHFDEARRLGFEPKR